MPEENKSGSVQMLPTINFKDTTRIFNLMLILLRVDHSCVGCILVAGRKENSSRLWLMCTFPWLWYLFVQNAFICSNQWDVKSVGCNSYCCCALSSVNHLLASGPQGQRGTLGHFPAPRQEVPLEGDLAALRQLRGGSHMVPRLGVPHQLLHSTAMLGGAQPQPENQFGKQCWYLLKSFKHQVAQRGNRSWGCPSMEGTIP